MTTFILLMIWSAVGCVFAENKIDPDELFQDWHVVPADIALIIVSGPYVWFAIGYGALLGTVDTVLHRLGRRKGL